MATKTELYTEACNRAGEVISAMNNKETQNKIKALRKTAQEALSEYNNAVEVEYYRNQAALHGADTLQELLRELYIPGLKKFDYKVRDNGEAYLAEGERKATCNLLKIQQTIGVDHFHSPDWYKRLSVLARLIAYSLNKELGDSAAFKYMVDEACATFDVPEDADPMSKTRMTKAFQAVIDDILFIGDKVDKKGNPVNGLLFTGKNWTSFRENMTYKGKKPGETVIMSPMRCADEVAEQIHLLITRRDPSLIVG